ncbi:hypothetical protein L228DRAFT_236434 [Xylona heveae TC161]|uniref:C2H2-type domain-containing protein n=1 Tax=Xylona heveae (strain CBS 132557 / TC161) TaxID=1328760 RepID=A0A165ISL2_XYLHT|nr:hypothetical protein L228DRAFT_236434 [Xylona heveae TC161]KZF25325.1 hypothetical protein L228DRAFT_236434 [Xylona heveae TC161]
MDVHFPPNGSDVSVSSGHLPQLTSLSGLQSQPLQHSHLPAHTLPPLQPQSAALSFARSVYSSSASSASHTPREAQSPNVSIPGTPSSQFPHVGSSSSLRDMGTGSYFQPSTSYQTSQPLPSTATLAHAQPHPIAPAPPHGRLPVPLRPMPSGGLGPLTLPSQYSPSPSLPQTPVLSDHEQQPTHVVGSQGRRGILPSAPGRAAAVGGNTPTSGKNTTIPAKDADGKFPCPHCNKTYLHAKHLKRHLLRHTGDRPYMCILCKDTFSRSDILKRHFQKCSLRRGNPTGASHLSHSQAHLKKTLPGQNKQAPAGSENPEFNLNGADDFHDNSLPAPIGGVSSTLPAPNQNKYLDEPHPALAPLNGSANGIKRPNSGDGRDQRSLTGPGPSGSNRASFDAAHGTGIPSTYHSTLDHGMPAYAMPNNQGHFSHGYDYRHHTPDHGFNLDANHRSNMYNGTHSGTGHEFDWSNMFHGNSHDGFMDPLFHSSGGHANLHVKPEQGMAHGHFDGHPDGHHDSAFPGLYQAGGVGPEALVGTFPHWNPETSQDDPLQAKADRLVGFCLSAEGADQSVDDYQATGVLRRILSVDNIKHFVQLFANYQTHWPIVHMPTFNIVEAFNGLVLGVLCLGAVYSDKVSGADVKFLMERTRAAIQRHFPTVFPTTKGSGAIRAGSRNNGPFTFEELQALFLFQSMCIWHGDLVQREAAKQSLATLVAMVRDAGFLHPAGPGSSAYSVLHQIGQPIDRFTADWDWSAWVEQEKRSRLMYACFLIDSSLTIYFNMPPQLNPFEIRLPLPADDAAWEAKTAVECADALGLHGSTAQGRNITGSRRIQQPEMSQALKALMSPVYAFQTRTTNVLSKFILIHALHILLWQGQRQISQGLGLAGWSEMSLSDVNLARAMPQNDWVSMSASSSAATSGRETPIEYATGAQSPGGQQFLKSMNQALQKWKQVWDEDLSLQYPVGSPRQWRQGLCRDAVHFYWLARIILRNYRALDWKVPADTRLAQVMSLLQKIKGWVASDHAARGEEVGSVGNIDDSFGVEDLNLDMKLIYKPISDQTTSTAVPGVGHVPLGL